MDDFETAKDRISMREVLEGYGIVVNRSRMCFCPFHNEKTPSCKVYSDSLHCFGCGEHHDIISFAKAYFNLGSQLEALKKLNGDFLLGLDLEKHSEPKKSYISEYAKRRNEKERYEKWEKNAWETLRDRFKMLRDFKRKYAPKSPYENIDERYAIACHHLEYAEYVLDEFMNTDYEERKIFKSDVLNAEKLIEKWKHYHSELPHSDKKITRIKTSELLKRRD